jgi:hypothetical protein
VEALVSLLAREKLLVELLVFKLVSMRQLLLAGETRFLPWAAEEVDRATAAVRDAELERGVLVAALGADRGLAEPALDDLVADAPDHWRSLLETSRGELRSLAREVQELLQVTRRLAEVGARSLAEALGAPPPQPVASPYADAAPARRYEQVL